MVAMALQWKAVLGSFENAAVSHAIKMNEHERLAFTLAEYERRYHLVMQGMERAGIEVLLVRTPENICYLTGYETPVTTATTAWCSRMTAVRCWYCVDSST